VQWNDFQDNIQAMFNEHRDNLDLSDVTFACMDGQNIEAHKLIITSSSPILKDIIMMNKHPHPLIYMKGVNAKNMSYIIDFIYHGEVNIFQEELEGFLELADELQLKGLQKTSLGEQDEKNHFIDEDCSTKTGLNKVSRKNDHKFENTKQSNQVIKTVYKINQNLFNKSNEIVCTGNDEIALDISGIEDLDERIKNMMEKLNNSWVCKMCAKSDTKSHIKNHIEAKHIAGVEHPCTICGGTFRSRNTLNVHISRIHDNKEV